jgi:hypothetical protein
MQRFVLLAFWCCLVVACGGGGGNPTPTTPAAPYLTADALGISSSANPTMGAPAPPAGTTDFGDAAAQDGREQVAREIEEADLYRVSGPYLYLLNAWRGLVVVDLEKFELVGRLPLTGFPMEMYLRGSRAFALVTDWQTGTRLLEIELANPAAPSVSRSAAIQGALTTSRVVGDVLYAVTDTGVQSFRLGPSPFEPADTLALDGGAQFAHATDAYAFITATDSSTAATPGTLVTIVDTSDAAGALSRRGTIDLPGYVADDQKLDAAGGVLRIVTHDWVDGGLSRLFTIDVTDPDHPAVLATLELARGEQLYATRFAGDRVYLVTFEQVDPLWIVNLSDPLHPAVAGQLEVPGFATQIVADGNRLVCLGIDTDTWDTVVSLFDVSTPASPTLLDRENLGSASTDAHWERKAFGVTPGRVLVPSWDGLSVLARDSNKLTRLGKVPVASGTLRGFTFGTDVVAAGAEEVVVADAATLDVRGRVTVARNVIDVGRLADGRLLELVQTGNRATLKGAELTLWADSLYVHGNAAAVLGWDDTGRAAYVVSFDGPAPTVYGRLALGSGDVAPDGTPAGLGGGASGDTSGGVSTGAGGVVSGEPGIGVVRPVYFGGADAILTSGGKLVVRGRPAGMPRVFGDGASFDGFVVIDIPAGALVAGVEIDGGAITGFTADGAVLAFTFAHEGDVDDQGRPLVRQDYVRIDLDTGHVDAPVNVAGYVIGARGAEVFLVDEQWDDGWSLTRSVAAARIVNGEAQVLDRLSLPEYAYDLRAAGSMLYYTEGNDGILLPMPADGSGVSWLPSATIHTVRLGSALAAGPDIANGDSFRWLLLPQDDAALIVRDGLTVERWDVSASEATLSWSSGLSGYPSRAHPDPAAVDRYLIALGYAGTAELP